MPAWPCDRAGGNHLSRTPVTWRLKRPTRELTDEQSASVQQVRAIPSVRSCSGWGLPSQSVTWLLVSSYLTISPLPGTLCLEAGRYVSVALSLRLPSLVVNQHSALWSSDFPRTLMDPRLSVLLKPAYLIEYHTRARAFLFPPR